MLWLRVGICISISIILMVIFKFVYCHILNVWGFPSLCLMRHMGLLEWIFHFSSCSLRGKYDDAESKTHIISRRHANAINVQRANALDHINPIYSRSGGKRQHQATSNATCLMTGRKVWRTRVQQLWLRHNFRGPACNIYRDLLAWHETENQYVIKSQ